MDSYMEMMVPRAKSFVDHLFRLLIVAGAVVIMFLSMTFLGTMIGALVTISVFYLAYILITNRTIEYEYAFTAGELDFDKIMAKKRRSHMLTLKCTKITYLDLAEGDTYQAYKETVKQKYDFSTHQRGVVPYYAVFMDDEGEKMFLFNPNERLLNNIKVFVRN